MSTNSNKLIDVEALRSVPVTYYLEVKIKKDMPEIANEEQQVSLVVSEIRSSLEKACKKHSWSVEVTEVV